MSAEKIYINQESSRLMKLATYASVGVAGILIIVKFYAWVITDSVSMMSSLIDSSLDIVVSLINMFAVRYALMPPDEDHKFGHTSAEDVAAMGQAAFVSGSALFISFTAIERLLNPHPIEHTAIGIYVMVFSLVMTFALVAFQKYVAAKTKSTAITADSLHYAGDLLMNGSVIAALLLSENMGWDFADPVFAIIISIYIIYGAWQIGGMAFDKLMDKEFPEEEKKKITEFILAHREVLGIHQLKTRYSGIKPFIQFHLELDGNQTLFSAHKIADEIENKLMEMYPGGDIIIHEDARDVGKQNSADTSSQAV